LHLFNANPAIFQLYHGKNKFANSAIVQLSHGGVMGIMLALNIKDRETIKLVFAAFCTTPECVVIFLLANVFTVSDI
jgi:hypothetical protein